jgi:hypothetical protein
MGNCISVSVESGNVRDADVLSPGRAGAGTPWVLGAA